MVRLLKAEATAQLSRDQRHPLAAYPDDDGSLPSPWTRKCWKVFLNSMDDVRAAVQYVEQNPIKDGKRRQRWPFVIPYV